MKTRLLAVLTAVALVPSSLCAADFGLTAVEVSAGIAIPEDFDAGFVLGAGLDLGDITRRLTLVASADYWRAEGSDFGADLEADNFSLGAGVRYYFAEARRGFYAGGGARLNHVTREFAVPLGTLGIAVVETEDDRLSPEGFLGWSAERFFLEGRINALEDLATVSLVVGVRFGG
jgi:hypothetical protein